MSDILRSLRRSNRALRRVWRRRRRELKRRICGECGYQARMHIDQRSNHTDAEILAAAANLDGAAEGWECEDWDHNPHHICDHGPPCGWVLSIPLSDKETPNG